jgi:hypothetical protein
MGVWDEVRGRGIVHQDIESAQFGRAAIEHPADCMVIADIAAAEDGSAAPLLDARHGLTSVGFGPRVVDGDVETAFGQQPRGAAANPRGRTGHQRNVRVGGHRNLGRGATSFIGRVQQAGCRSSAT